MTVKANNKTAANTYELEITVDAAAFEAALQKAYLKARGKIQVNGFRKGKAPRKMIEKLYGSEVFYEDAVNALVPEETAKAVMEADLKLVDRPAIEVTQVNKAEGVTFKATCTVKPEVKISDYMGIEAKKEVKEVTDEDITEQIEKIRQRNARLITVEDRAAQKDDDVLIDFEGFIDGVAFEGGKAEKFDLTLGSGQFIPGFEDQVIGHNSGDEFEIQVSFPEDYQMKDLAGKPAMFKIKLHEIKMKELPELDDEFVKDSTDFETLDALKEDMKKKLEEQNQKRADSKVENDLVQALIDKVEAEVPEVMFSNRANELIQDFAQRLGQQGMNLDLYLQYTGMDVDAFKKTFEERAHGEVMLRLALEQIAKQENIEVSGEEIEQEYQRIAEMNHTDVERIKQYISEEDFVEDMKVNKAMKMVKDALKIVE